jgi:hypothetical protein
MQQILQFVNSQIRQFSKFSIQHWFVPLCPLWLTIHVIIADLNISFGAAGAEPRRGKSMRNVVPFPGVLSTLMLP